MSFVSNIYAEDELQISSNVIPITNKKLYRYHSKLYPIGINDRYFAYLKQEYSEGEGQYEYIFIIKDLITDAEKENIYFSSVKNFKQLLIGENKQVITKNLSKYFITPSNEILLHDFPLKLNSTAFTASIEEGEIITEDFIEYHYKNIILQSSKNIKKIGTVAEIVFAKHLKYKNYQLLGYIINDKKTRMVVLVTYVKHEDETSDFIPDFKLFGSSFDFK
jgi:hypothetical protein